MVIKDALKPAQLERIQVAWDRHEAPWWRFWIRRPSAREVQTVLVMLRYRRNVGVVERARALRHSPDPQIAGAARALVDNA